MKKIIIILPMAILLASIFVGCTGSNSAQFDVNKDIAVISREDGSGTRSAFIDLFHIEQKNADGSKKDMTTKEAVIAKQTDVMMTNISTDKYTIGYISLGSLNEAVKALDIEGVKATAENVKNDTYPIRRPFIIATKGKPTGLTKDFIDFILSKEGQEVVVKDNRISVNDNASDYSGSKPDGKIVVAGSSSVTPTMEKLKEAYILVNPNATIEIQQSDSSAGMTGAIDGTCNIGMASRELKDSELEKLTPIEFAFDGIAIIVNKENTFTTLTKEQVKSIFTGEITKWSEVSK